MSVCIIHRYIPAWSYQGKVTCSVFSPYSERPGHTVLWSVFEVVCVSGWGSAAACAVVLQRSAGKSLPCEVSGEHLPVPALTDKPTLKQAFSLFHIIWHTLDLLSIPKLQTAGCPLSAGRRSAQSSRVELMSLYRLLFHAWDFSNTEFLQLVVLSRDLNKPLTLTEYSRICTT